MGRIWPKLGQVLLLYWRYLTSSWILIVGFIGVICLFGIMIAAVFYVGDRASPANIYFLYLAGGVIYALKRQIIQIRERRIPGALAAHLWFALFVLGAAVFGLPLLSIISGTPVPIAQFAVYAMATALVSWTIICEQWWIAFLGPIAGAGLNPTMRSWHSQPVLTFFVDFWTGRYEGLATALFAVGLAGIALAILYLIDMSEEERGYLSIDKRFLKNFYRQQSGGLRAASSPRIWRSKHLRLSDPTPKQVRQWRNWVTGSLWKQVLVATVPRGRGMHLVVPIMALVSMLWMAWGGHAILSIQLPFYVAFFGLGPLFFAFQLWHQQRPLWPVELLRPWDRSRFITVSGLALARQVVLSWTLTVGVFVVAAWLLEPNDQSLIKVLRGTAFSAGMQPLLFGIAWWLFQFQERGVLIVAMAIGATAYFLAWTWFYSASPSWAVVAFLAAAMTMVGLVFTVGAFRSWLESELG